MHTFFRLSGAFALGFAGIVGASAADQHVEPVAPGIFRPPPPRVFNWTMCYLGGHVGWAFADNELTGLFLAPADPLNLVNVADTLPINFGSNGFLVGGQFGCNVQFARSWVIGVEADASWANVSGNSRQTLTGSFPGPLFGLPTTSDSDATLSTKTDFIATVTGRLGYTFGSIGQGMIYGKGGVAWIANRHSLTGGLTSVVCVAAINPPPQCLASSTFFAPFNWTGRETRVGWTIGAGVEWAMLGNWTIKGEYAYLDFGTETVALNDQVLGPVNVSVQQRISEVKFGINYRFGPSIAPWY